MEQEEKKDQSIKYLNIKGIGHPPSQDTPLSRDRIKATICPMGSCLREKHLRDETIK